MSARCRSRQPRPRQALLHDPQLLRIRPTPTTARLHHLEPAHLMTVSNDVHEDSQHRSPRCYKAAAAGGLHKNVSSYEWLPTSLHVLALLWRAREPGRFVCDMTLRQKLPT